MASDRVDRNAKVIRGYSVMSLGEAKGHGMIVDEATLDQLVQLGNASPGGIKTRVHHPNPNHDGFGRLVGKSKNFRREGDKVVSDLYVSEAAHKSPEGDLGSYVLELAASEDDTFGASPEVRTYKQNIPGAVLPSMRLKELKAIAIVDEPATNIGFFSCLSEGDTDMADNAAIETKVAELSAERDLLAEEVARLKAENTQLQANLTVKGAELSAAKQEATQAAITAERARAADIIALCSKAGKTDLSAKHIADGTAVTALQSALFDVLCAANKPIGDDSNADLSAKPDPDAEFKAEYAAERVLLSKAGITEEDYLKSRRISTGAEMLIAR